MNDRLLTGPSLVLDAQALSLLADDDRRMTLMLDVARRESFAPTISSISVVEQRRAGKAGKRLAWIRSRLTVVPVTGEIADTAAALLEGTGLSGHECVVDAVVVATAASASGPAKVVTSDASHMPALCKEAGARRDSRVTCVRI